MPVIGYKHQYYKGSCWKRAIPDKRWLYVDTEYRGSSSNLITKGYIRFGTITFIRVY